MRAQSRPWEMTQMQHPEPVARRLFELTEPISLVNFFSPEPNESMAALGFRNYWDGYFAGRSAPLGRVPAEVVHAAFYNFADGEVARHIPKVWDTTTPEAAHAAREQGCVAALRRILGDLVETPGLARAAELLAKASTGAPTEGRVMYAGLRALPMPEEPVARLWHAANMLREHRGDGHIAALVAERIGGTEAHVLSALDMGIYPAESFGRIHHLPEARLAEVMDGLRDRGLLDASGRFTDAGRATKDRIESLTDALAEAAVRRAGAARARPADRLARAHLQKAPGHRVEFGGCGLTVGQRRPALLRAGSPRSGRRTPASRDRSRAPADDCSCRHVAGVRRGTSGSSRRVGRAWFRLAGRHPSVQNVRGGPKPVGPLVRLLGMRRTSAGPAAQADVSDTGSRRSFSALYERHAAASLRLAYLLTGEPELAEDLVQDAFVKMLGRFDDLRHPDAFEAYLRRTLVNLSHSTFRRRRLERAYVAREGQHLRTAPVAPVPDLEVQNELWHRLQRIAPRQRAALVLRYYLDLSELETAEALGCSLRSVKSLVSRGLGGLRDQLDEQGGERA